MFPLEVSGAGGALQVVRPLILSTEPRDSLHSPASALCLFVPNRPKGEGAARVSLALRMDKEKGR